MIIRAQGPQTHDHIIPIFDTVTGAHAAIVETQPLGRTVRARLIGHNQRPILGPSGGVLVHLGPSGEDFAHYR